MDSPKAHDYKKRGTRRDIRCENLGLKLQSGARVLCDVNFTFRAGHLTAIMGPSGSGKTTLLTAVAGRTQGLKVCEGWGSFVLGRFVTRQNNSKKKKATGRTLVNGVQTDLNRYQRSIGFVPQEDVMFRDCTVREIMTFSALIRSDRQTTLDERKRVANDYLHILGLDDVSDTLIGKEITI